MKINFLVLVCGMFLTGSLSNSALAQSGDTAYLAEMPSVDRVVSALQKPEGNRDNASRISAALDMLAGIVMSLSEGRYKAGQLTQEETAKISKYKQLSEQIWENVLATVDMNCQGSNDPDSLVFCEKYALIMCKGEYTHSEAFRRELLTTFFSPAWQQQYVDKIINNSGYLWDYQHAMGLPASIKFETGLKNCADWYD
ncbi:MAG: hypothetical protein WC504_06750 [Methylobacter sp.]